MPSSAAGGIPLLLRAVPAGVVVHRFDRRKVLLAAQWLVMFVAGWAPLAPSPGRS